MLDPQRGNAAKTQLFCGLHRSMTGDDRARCIDQDRIDKSEAFDRSSNLLDLALRMRARVVLIRFECLKISQFRSRQRNCEIDLLVLEQPAAAAPGRGISAVLHSSAYMPARAGPNLQ